MMEAFNHFNLLKSACLWDRPPAAVTADDKDPVFLNKVHGLMITGMLEYNCITCTNKQMGQIAMCCNKNVSHIEMDIRRD